MHHREANGPGLGNPNPPPHAPYAPPAASTMIGGRERYGRLPLRTRVRAIPGNSITHSPHGGNPLAFELPPLPYDYSALEPYIDTETMKLHHDKHHQTYVTNLNGAIEKHPDLGKHSAEDLLRNLNSVPEDVRTVVRNNGGGHVNHSMFWAIMKPGGGGEPTGAIGDQIKKDFASFEDFKKQFNETTAKQFGSGWAGWCGTAS